MEEEFRLRPVFIDAMQPKSIRGHGQYLGNKVSINLSCVAKINEQPLFEYYRPVFLGNSFGELIECTTLTTNYGETVAVPLTKKEFVKKYAL